MPGRVVEHSYGWVTRASVHNDSATAERWGQKEGGGSEGGKAKRRYLPYIKFPKLCCV